MIKVKLSELIAAKNNIQEKVGENLINKNNLEEFCKLNFKGKIRLGLIKVLIKVNQEIQAYEQTKDFQILSYNYHDEISGALKVPDDKLKEFHEFNIDLLKVEISIDAEKIKYSEIEENNPEFSISVVASLPWLVEI